MNSLMIKEFYYFKGETGPQRFKGGNVGQEERYAGETKHISGRSQNEINRSVYHLRFVFYHNLKN